MDLIVRRFAALLFAWIAFLFLGAALAMTLWPDPRYTWHAVAGSVIVTTLLTIVALRLWRRRTLPPQVKPTEPIE